MTPSSRTSTRRRATTPRSWSGSSSGTDEAVAKARLRLLQVNGGRLEGPGLKDAILAAAAEDAWRLSGSGPGLLGVPKSLQACTPARFGYIATHGQHLNPRHLAILDHHLIQLAFGEIDRLAVLMPPRHGKSERCSKFFPAWYAGTFPDHQIILTAYGSSFAAEWGQKARDLLQEFGRRHFGVTVRQDSRASSRWMIEGRSGVMRTAGVGAGVTGRGAHLLIIDDPIKNADEAMSPVYRNKVWNWWLSTSSTRLEPGGKVLLIQTRWHEDDLGGRLLDQAARLGPGHEWTVLKFPALAEEDDPLGREPGEALWPARYPVEALNRIRETQDDPAAGLVANWWDALFQQSPVPRSGGYFDLEWPSMRPVPHHATPVVAWARYWDKAASTREGACRTAGVKMGLDVFGRYVVAHSAVVQEGPANREEFIRKVAEEDGTAVEQVVEVEGGSSGVDAAQATAANLAGYRVTLDRPSGEKTVRAQPYSDQMKAGNVVILDGPWAGEYVRELQSFPYGKWKDQVDASSGAFNHLAKKRRQGYAAAVGGSRLAANATPDDPYEE